MAIIILRQKTLHLKRRIKLTVRLQSPEAAAGNEVLETGTITADKLEGPMAGKQVSDLAFAGANGSLYMNIHTVENPNGEIRGTSTVSP